jgi:PAS domain S-box-containing protein
MPSRSPMLVRHAWAGITVLFAVVLSLMLAPLTDRSAVAFFVAAVAVTAWRGGLGPSLVATVLGVAAVDYLLIPPVYAFEMNETIDLIDLAVFGLVAVLVSSLHRNLLEARQHADAARIAAEAERARVETILESISDAFLVLDREWRYTYLNNKAVAMTRRSAGDLLGKRIWDVYPRLMDTPLHHAAAEAMDRRVEARAEHNITHTDIWLAVQAYPSEQGVSLYFQDISARKHAELAAREQQEWLETTLSSIGDAVIATDVQGQIRFLNPVAELLTGWKLDDAVGQPLDTVFVIVNEQTRASVESPIAKVLRDGVVTGLANHTVLIARDGTEWPIDDSGAPIRGAQNEIVGAVLVFREISERKREEDRVRFLADVGELLSESLEYRSTLQTVARLSVPVLADWAAIDMLQDDGSLQRLAVEHQDPSKVELAHELHRRYPPDLGEPDGLPQVLRTGEPAFYPEIPDELLVAGARDDEHLRIARELGLRSAIIAPLTARGRTLGAVSFVSAESGRRYTAADLAFAEDLARRAALAVDNARLYQAEQRAHRVAQEAVQIRDTFMSVISHDLRNPLAGIKGYVQLMRRRGAYSEQTIDRIETQVGLLERLIGDLADVASLHANRLELRPQQVNLGDLVQECVDQAARQSTSHHFEMAAPTPAPVGSWDPDRLRQVLQNLLTNAIKYAPHGGDILVTVQDLGNEAQVRVRDEGLGIPSEALPQLFDQFYRVQDQSSVPGLGLGLYIARSLIEAHGGKIWAESDGPDRGSTFSLTLPTLQDDEGATARADHEADSARTQTGASRILVVDDEATIRDFVSDLLRDEGYAVQSATNGREALDLLSSWRSDAILLDLMMPVMDGATFLAHREEDPELTSIPVIVMSANRDARMQIRPFSVASVVQKPFDVATLLTLVGGLTSIR